MKGFLIIVGVMVLGALHFFISEIPEVQSLGFYTMLVGLIMFLVKLIFDWGPDIFRKWLPNLIRRYRSWKTMLPMSD